MNFINLTPHTVNLYVNGEEISFISEGIARVESIPGSWAGTEAIDGGTGLIFESPTLGELYVERNGVREAFPEEFVTGNCYIVSLICLQHPSLIGRRDVVAPGTGPNDGAIRFPRTVDTEYEEIHAPVDGTLPEVGWVILKGEVINVVEIGPLTDNPEEVAYIITYTTPHPNAGQIKAVTRFILPLRRLNILEPLYVTIHNDTGMGVGLYGPFADSDSASKFCDYESYPGEYTVVCPRSPDIFSRVVEEE